MTLAVLHATYAINTEVAKARLKAIREACLTCAVNLTLPKSTEHSHIASKFFGERILVDCKTVTGHGFFVVAVDHFTTYLWAAFLKRKFAQPIADFVVSVWKDVTSIRRERRRPGGLLDDPEERTWHFASDIGKQARR